ncbi:MAG: DNA repair protein RadC [archaeon]
MKIAEISPDNRPRERMACDGPKSLSDSELLAVILQKGTKKNNVIDMSNRILSRFSKESLFDATKEELQKINGIGFAKSMQIIALVEFSKRLNSVTIKPNLSNAYEVYKKYAWKFKFEKKEHFMAVYLDIKNYIIKEEIISIGILDSAIIHPREIFRPAIKNSASKIIIMHNHPSGDPSPSGEDISITNQLIEAGKLIGISILDHVIIGNNSYWSYIENEVKKTN